MSRHGEAAVNKDCRSQGRFCVLVATGFSWTQIDAGVYKRFLLRRCVECGVKEHEPLFRWIPTKEFCTWCGSQQYDTEPLGEELMVLTCSACARQQKVYLKEPQDGNV